MKKKKITLILFLAVSTLVLTMSSCKPDDPEPCYDCDKQKLARDTIYNNETFLSYCFFPEGSWWIYKRTDTAVEIYDTVTVLSDRRFIYSDWTSYQNDFERIFQELKHTRSNFLGIKDTEKTQKNNSPEPGLATSAYDDYFVYPYFEGENPISNNRTIEINGNEYLKIPLGTYNNATKITANKPGFYLWLIEGIGLSKIITPNEGTWELNEYYINK